jgi:DNA-binding FadR family transcriptional regulator
LPDGGLEPRRPKSLYRRQNTIPREVVEARTMLAREAAGLAARRATDEELEMMGCITGWMATVHTPR